MRKPIDTMEQIKDMGAGSLMYFGLSGAIEREEQAGQDYLVSQPEMLPKDMRPDRSAFERLGFSFGEDIDELFIKGGLPSGWKKRASDHPMWSHIYDEKGRERVAIFYKAAFYDRGSFMKLCYRFRVTYSACLHEMDGQPKRGLVLDADGSIVWESAPPTEEEMSLPDYEIHSRLEEAAMAWLQEHYPDNSNPEKYWD